MTEPGAGALAGLRVLDLTGHRAQLCARILADMGADVIKVEPPAGDDARRIGPFLDDLPHRDRSLFFWFYNLNKRSLTLDLKHSRGADIFLQLARSADVVIESFAPGTLDQLGLGWDVLHRENPALVLCSIAPFGQTGPYRDFVADDTVLTALGGMLYVNGFPNHAPVRPLGLQAYHSSAYFGAIAVMLALLARDATAEGQWIDLSMQEATAAAVEHVAGGYFERNEAEPRRGTLHWSRFFRVGKCRDGYIMHCTLGDWTSLIEWVKSDGKAADLDAPDYQQPMYRYLMAEHVFEVLDDWVKDYPRDELLERAQLAAPALRDRAPARGAVRRRAAHRARLLRRGRASRARPQVPLPGRAVSFQRHAVARHAASAADRRAYRRNSARRARDGSGSARRARRRRSDLTMAAMPLDGVRILDFTWVVAGPVATRILGDHGAQVVKVERKNPPPLGNRKLGLQCDLHRSKLSVALNMQHPRGVELARRLAAMSDIVMDNFSARVMRTWGMDYAEPRSP